MLSRPSFFRFNSLSLAFLVCFFLSACGSGGGGESSPQTPEASRGFSSSSVHASDFESSPLCPGGGVEIHTGVDVNQNGLLDESEINATQELCHLESDRIMAVVEPLSVDSECAFGGNRLKIGYDQNNNDLIDADEVNQSLLLCHQQALTQLAMAVFRYDQEPEGENCTFGGTSQSIGIDRNNNGLLDDSEITSSQYYCETNQPVIPYYYAEACENRNCDEIVDPQTYYLMTGDNSTAYLANFYDDGVGTISLNLNQDAPDWLSLSVERQDYYSGIFTYLVLVDQASIPDSAADQEFEVRVTVSDGENQFDLVKKIKVIRPIRISLNAQDLNVTEPGSDKELTKFIKVKFDRPLPADLSYIAELPNNALSSYFVNVYKVAEDGGVSSISRNNDDFVVSWLGDFLYPGQTEATIMLKIKDDFLPEGTENFRITVENPYFYRSSELRFLGDSIDFSILDDADQAITTTIELDSSEVIEGTLSETSLPVSVDFKLKFDKPLPSNAYISLKLSPLDGDSLSSYDRDLGFDNNCYQLDYYCNNQIYLTIGKGLTEYSSNIKIRSDHNFEQNERFELKVVSQNSSFKFNDSSAILTIIDDDSLPEIGFSETSVQRYYKDSLVYAPVKLNAKSFEPVSFSINVNSASTLLEGVHFDFGLSMPVTLQPGQSEFSIPILIYGEEFSTERLQATFDINVVQGASVSSESGSLTLVLDKISPFRFNENNLVIPLSSGQISSSRLHMDEQFNIYKTGRVNGVISGQTPVGDDDLFVAKFDSQQRLIWAKQFGSEQYDYYGGSLFDKRSKQFIISSSNDLLFVLSEEGEVRNLSSHISNLSFTLIDAKTDPDGNLYLAGRKSTSIDLDADGFRTSFVVMKFSQNLDLQWVQEDFSDFSDMTNTYYYVYDISMELTESGVPFLFGSMNVSTFNGSSRLGGNDYFLTVIDPASGILIDGHLFGSTGYDDNTLHIASYGADQIIVFYNVDGGDTVGSETATQLQGVKVIVDENGNIQNESFLIHSDNSYGIRSFQKASDGSYFLTTGAYYNTTIYNLHYDAYLNELSRQKNVYDTNSYIKDFFAQSPVLADDGGYYLGSGNSFVKIAPDMRIRN